MLLPGSSAAAALSPATGESSNASAAAGAKHQELIYSSPYPDIEIPDVTFSEIILERCSQFGDKVAMVNVMTGRKKTYRDVVNESKRFAAGLASRGYKKGDVLVINSPNKPEYPIIIHGACMLGGVVSPTSPQHTAEELAGQLMDSKAKFLVTVPALLPVAHQAATLANLPTEDIIVVHEEDVPGPYSQYHDMLPEAVALPKVHIDPKVDCAILPYSSGTTGKPKGVRLSHRNLVANLLQIAAVEKLTTEDTLIAVLPFFHIYGLQLLVSSALYAGATAALMPVFQLETFLQTLQDYKITGAHIAPPIVVALAKHPVVGKYDLSHLHYLFSGAAPLSRELSEAVTARLGCKVRQAYGASEISPAATITPMDKIKEGSVGPLLPNTIAKVLCTETGVTLPPNKVGELCIKGPQVMLGYHERAEATADTVRDGFFHTGDTAFIDDDGYVFIVDRLKEILKYKGHQVPPAELEGILLDHPSIADCAVIGSPDETSGDIPKAFVQVKEGCTLTESEVMQHVADRVAPYKRIRMVEFIDAIPKSAAGKILRRILVDKERARVAASAKK